jgi:hypothetical protein
MCTCLTNEKYYCQEMHDNNYCEIAETAMSELQKKSDITHLAGIFRHIRAKHGKTQWEMMYGKCSIRLITEGTEITINNPSGRGYHTWRTNMQF